MTQFPWYTLVGPTEPLTQGDFIEACPHVRLSDMGWADARDAQAVLERLGSDEESLGLQEARAIVMTQACDLANGKVRDAVLCPVKTLQEFRESWEYEYRVTKSKSPRMDEWDGICKRLKAGREHAYALLEAATLAGGQTVPHHVALLDEAFSVPVTFLAKWVSLNAKERVRLLPPYREYLSQCFARFFMRVALPVDLSVPK